MLLLIKKINLIIFCFFVFSMVLVQGVFFYHVLTKKDISKYTTLFLGETILFSSIVICILTFIIFYTFMAKSKKVDIELDRLGEASERNSYVPNRAKRTLGSLGEKINRIVSTTSYLSELRRHQIIAQTNLLNIVLEHTKEIFFVLNTDGKIIYISNMALKHYHISYSDAINSYIKKFNEEFRFDKALATLLHDSSSLSYTDAGFKVYSAMANNTPHYFFVMLDDGLSG